MEIQISEKCSLNTADIYKLKSTIQYLPSATGILKDYCFIDANPCLCELLDYDYKEIINKHIGNFFINTVNVTIKSDKDIRLNFTDNKGNFETVLKQRNGDCLEVIIDYKFIADNKFDNYLIFTITNITRQKYIESLAKEDMRELIIANEAYLDTNEKLKIAIVKAEESDRLKSAFLATMNHELRTPIAHILGMSGMLLSDGSPNTQEYGEIIYQSGLTLLHMVEDIFELSLLQQSVIKPRVQSFSCHRMFLGNQSVLNEILINAGKENQIEAVYKIDRNLINSIVTSDKNKINQVLSHLFTNAVKFTESGTIEFGLRSNQPGWITFYITDTGIGISQNEQEYIFELFRQIDDSYSRKYNGIGVGLTICQKIAGIMNGNLTFKSGAGKGSTFYFSIPVEITEITNEG